MNQMKRKLWNRDFVLLLQANAVSTLGDLMYSVAIGYWVYQKTGSSGLMGIMSAISMFVTMFLSPFTGSIADKCNRKWMIVGMDVFQGVLMLAVGLLAWMDALNVPLVLAAAFLAALGGVFYSPAARTLMIDIIPHEDMVRGQSLHSGVLTLIDLVGSAFSGAMVAFLGVPLIVVINGLSNLWSAASELLVRVPRTVRQGTPVTAGGLMADLKRAVSIIFSDRSLRLFVPCALVLNLLGAGPLSLTLPFCMEKGFSVELYGVLMAVFTAASLLTVLLLGVLKLSAKARYWILALGFSGSLIFFILGYLSSRFVPLCVMAFLASMFNCAGNIILNASLMLALPEGDRGGVLGVIQSASVGGTALSVLLYGLLGDVLALYLVFVAGNILSIPPMLYLCFHPHTKGFILEHGNDQ